LARPGGPNAVFILVDDLGHNDVAYNNRSADGTTAGRLIQSPNIDEMADTGIKLLHYYVQPICTPTRSALMTGRYAIYPIPEREKIAERR
jgi:arylsulfatase A-like enzyme